MKLQQVYPQIKEKGDLIVLASVPLQEVKSGKEQMGLGFPVLADEQHVAAESCGKVIRPCNGE